MLVATNSAEFEAQIMQWERKRAKLSDKQLRYLRLVAKGYTRAAIARICSANAKTIDSHISGAYKKLGVAGSIEALIELGYLIHPSVLGL